MGLFTKDKPAETFPVEKSEAEWRAELSPEAFRVLRQHATERPGTSKLLTEKRPGVFACAGCGHELFDNATKFESGTGWTSFFRPLEGGIATTTDRSFFMTRTECIAPAAAAISAHVFPDGPAPTGERYCMNGVAMVFQPAE